MGSSSYLLHSPLHKFLSPPSSSTSSYSCLPVSSRPHFLYMRNGESKRRVNRAPPMASLHSHLGPQELDSCKRRALLILGISVFPLLPLKDQAFQALASDEQGSGKENEKAEQMGQESASSNPFQSLLNSIGILGSGVLGALYTLARKEKVTSEEMIEFLNSQLKEKDAAIVSLGKNYEARLLNQQEEKNKLLSKAKEDQLSLENSLELANGTIAGLGRELQNEKRKIEELAVLKGNLETELEEAGKDKRALEDMVKEKDSSIAILQEKINLLSSEIKEEEETISSLKSTIEQKDSDLEKLNSAYKQTKDELSAISLDMRSLKDELLKKQSELEQTNLTVDDLNNRVSSLTIERDNLATKLKALEDEYDNLKSSSTEKAASDAKLLGEMEHELQQLKEKYDLAVNEINAKQAMISDLTQDKDNLNRMLDTETNHVKDLKQELQLAQEALGSSRNEVSDLNKQLQESKQSCSELEAALSKVQTEFSEAKESFQKSLNEATLRSEALTGELTSLKEVLDKTKHELQVMSNELAATVENRDSLEKELVDVYKTAEVATNDLEKEKKMVADLKNDLQALEKEISRDKEARKSLEADLEETTKSLDEVSRNALMLSKELEMANTRVSSLEEEKDFLSSALEKEKKAAQEARENLEDANSVVMRLGSERESLEKRAKSLEEDLASTKGEILRLRNQINSSKAVVNRKSKQENELVNGGPKQESKPVVDSKLKAESEPVADSDAEQESEPAVDSEPKPAVSTASSTPAKRTTRRRKASNQ